MIPHKEINSYFKRRVRKGKSSFSSYCKQLCERSLITGFPVIASTRNFVRKIIKVLVFMVCICGFLYQTSEFLKLYRAYPTIVDIRIERPPELDTPALSFCNENRIRRKVLCITNASDCYWFKKRDDLCLVHPRYCISEESEASTVLGIPLFHAHQGTNRSRKYVQKLGESYEDFMGECAIKAQVNSSCRNHLDVSWVDGKGFPNNCFTVESLWGLPEAQAQKMPLTGKIYLLLKPQPENYLVYYDLIRVYVSLHEAHSLGNPFTEGIAFHAGKTYNIFVTQRLTERLPAPYQTNCTDYLQLWKKNGGFGPLTYKACAEQCKMKNMLETEGCVAKSVNYHGDYVICDDPDVIPSDYILQKCSLQCKEACKEVSYITRHELAYDQSKKCGADENCMFKDVYLNFIFNRMEIEKFVHQPRYESVEMFSYIGGYMGMWLGISLVAIFDFVETLMALVLFTFKNKRRKTTVQSYY